MTRFKSITLLLLSWLPLDFLFSLPWSPSPSRWVQNKAGHKRRSEQGSWDCGHLFTPRDATEPWPEAPGQPHTLPMAPTPWWLCFHPRPFPLGRGEESWSLPCPRSPFALHMAPQRVLPQTSLQISTFSFLTRLLSNSTRTVPGNELNDRNLVSMWLHISEHATHLPRKGWTPVINGTPLNSLDHAAPCPWNVLEFESY